MSQKLLLKKRKLKRKDKMTKISIENFQSIKKVDFEVKGLTVIIGKNNIGKSAIIRAINAALNNQTGNNFIRKGTKETKVTIDYKDLVIKWIKSKNSASYNITGYSEPFTKLSGAVPKPILDAGFQNIQIGEHKFYPLITSQFDPLFLINKRGSIITEVLANLYQIDILSTADDLCQKVIRSNKSLLKTRESDLKNAQEKLEQFKDFTEIKETVKSLVKKETEIENLHLEIQEINLYEEKIKKLLESISHLKKTKDIKIPKITDCEKVISELPWLQNTDDKYQKSLAIIKKLKNVSKVTIPEISKCEKLISELPWIQDIDNKHNKSTSLIKKLKSVSKINIPEKTDYENLFSEVQWLQKKDGKYCELYVTVEKLKKVPKIEIPEIKSIETLLNKTIQIREWDDTINTISKEIKRQEVTLESINLKKITESIKNTNSLLNEFIRIQEIEKGLIKIAKATRSTRTEKKAVDEDYSRVNKKMSQFKICPLCERSL